MLSALNGPEDWILRYIRTCLYVFMLISCQENVVIDEADTNGKTPLMLAVGRKHYTVIKYLKDELNMNSGFCFIPKLDMW